MLLCICPYGCNFMPVSVWSICVLSSLWDSVCTVYMTVCKFMVHALTLLICVSLMRLMYSMCGRWMCAWIRSVYFCVFIFLSEFLHLSISLPTPCKESVLEPESRWKAGRQRTSMKQGLSKQTITAIKTIHSPAHIPLKWIASPALLWPWGLCLLGQCLQCVCQQRQSVLLNHCTPRDPWPLSCCVHVWVCHWWMCVCVFLAGGTTLSAFGGLPSDHLRVHSAFIKDKRGSHLSLRHDVMML